MTEEDLVDHVDYLLSSVRWLGDARRRVGFSETELADLLNAALGGVQAQRAEYAAGLKTLERLRQPLRDSLQTLERLEQELRVAIDQFRQHVREINGVGTADEGELPRVRLVVDNDK
jgi:uncharacterized protein involved in exopolysaccharide biosynthesis